MILMAISRVTSVGPADGSGNPVTFNTLVGDDSASGAFPLIIIPIVVVSLPPAFKKSGATLVTAKPGGPPLVMIRMLPVEP